VIRNLKFLGYNGGIIIPEVKNKTSLPYVILGSGGIGFAVAKELEKQGKPFIVVDKDEVKVETLRDQDFEAIVGDIGDLKTLESLDIKKAVAILILSSDVEANKTALNYFKKVSPDTHVIVRALNPTNRDELENMGADFVILPSKVVANVVVRSLNRAESSMRARDLLKPLKKVGDGTLAIIVHDNPDPDAISSAMALKEIAKSIGVESKILYRGESGYQENKALINLLKIPLERIEKYSLEDFNKIALIEGSIPGVNNFLPKESEIGIIIDHHPADMEKVNAEYIDIRPNLGATATIMTKYLQELDIPIKKELATALIYGIRTDTNDFKRNTDPSDLTSAAFLYPLADHDILAQIETPPMSSDTLDVLGDAIKNRKIRGSYLISNVGFIRSRDSLAKAADYLLNLEAVSTVLVFGLSEDQIYISGRSKDIRLNLGDAMSRAFGEKNAGGHATSAGAQIPLGVFSETKDKQTLMRLAEEAVMKKFFSIVGVEEEEEA